MLTHGVFDTRTGSLRERLGDVRLLTSRAVLRRRRLLAGLLAGVAVLSGIRAVQPPPEDAIVVPVAARDLPAGAQLEADDVVSVAFRPGTDPEGVVDTAVGRVLAGPMLRGEPITDVRLVGAGLARAHQGRVATPVRIPDAATAALLRVGDRIDLWAADPQGGAAGLVAADAVVLAVPAAVADDTLPGRLVVLAVAPDEAGTLAGTAVTHFLTLNWSR